MIDYEAHVKLNVALHVSKEDAKAIVDAALAGTELYELVPDAAVTGDMIRAVDDAIQAGVLVRVGEGDNDE